MRLKSKIIDKVILGFVLCAIACYGLTYSLSAEVRHITNLTYLLTMQKKFAFIMNPDQINFASDSRKNAYHSIQRVIGDEAAMLGRINAEKKDPAKGRYYYRLAQIQYKKARDHSKVLDIYVTFAEEGLKKNNPEMGAYYYHLAGIYADSEFGNQALANKYLQDSLKLSTNDLEMQADNYTSLGIVHRKMNDTENATAYYNKAVAIYEELEDPRGMFYVLNNQANCNLVLGYLEDARNQAETALDIYVDYKMNDPAMACAILDTLGEIYTAQGKYSQAEEYFLWAIKNSKIANLPSKMVSDGYLHLSKLYVLMGKEQEAEKFKEKAQNPLNRKDIFEVLNDQIWLVEKLFIDDQIFLFPYHITMVNLGLLFP